MALKPTVSNLLRVARGELGYHETGGPHGDDGNITKYGSAYGIQGAWCAMFAWWCFTQLGIDLRARISAYFAGVVYAVQGWKDHGEFHPGVTGIRPGDVVYFDFPGEASVDHVGLIESVDANGYHTIEGNTSPGTAVSDPNGGGVYRRLRPASQIVGYGRYPGLRYDLGSRAKTAVKKAITKRYPTLKRDRNYGDNVRRLQALLAKQGLYRGIVDGVYGAMTEAAVRRYQTASHLYVDGVAGPKTLAALKY